MRIYEELFIIKPDTPEEGIDAYLEQLKELITKGDGTVDKVEKWGVRKLAYRVEKRNEGFYVLLQFTAGPAVVKEVERRMRVTDLVLKFITVRIDEKLKKIEKRKKIREKRAKRRPAPVMAVPAAPGAPGALGAPAMPGAPAPGHPGEAAAVPAVAAAPVAPAAAEPVAAVETAEKEQ